MKKITSRFLALVLAAVMTLGIMPINIFIVNSEAVNYTYPNTHTSLPGLTGDQLIDALNIARSQLGYTENSEGSSKYGAWRNASKGAGWCNFFVQWCLDKAGVSFPKTNSAGYILRKDTYSKDFSLIYHSPSNYEPKSGDVYITPWHMGFVIFDENGETIGGNQGDSGKGNVSYRSISAIKKYFGGIVYYITPNYRRGIAIKDVDKTLLVSVTGKHSKNVPYADGKNVKLFNTLNEEVHAKKSVINIYNNLWYQLDDDSWVFSGNFSEKAVAPVKTHASKSSNVKTNKKVTSLPPIEIIPENDDYTIPGPAPVLDGYVFMGYSTKEKADKPEYQIGQKVKVPKGGLNLYTVWKQKTVTMSLSEESAKLDITNYNDTSKTTKVIKAEAKGELSAKNTRQVIEAKSNNTYVADVEVTDNNYSSFLLWDKIAANIKIKAKSPGTTKIQVTVSDLNGKNKVQQHINVKVDCRYKITYYTDILSEGGKVYDKATQWKTYGKDITLSSYIPEKENFKFSGWTQETGSLSNPHVEYGPGDLYKMEHDTAFYPVWVKDNKITWNPPVNGVLTIGGSGDMPSYSVNKAPWQEYKSSIKKVVINEGVTSIGSNAFYGYTNLEEVTIPEGVTYVGNNAFYNTGIKSISFPVSIRKIGNDAYGNCKMLEHINFKQFNASKSQARGAKAAAMPADVEIGAFAFENCTSLKTIDIPDATGAIGAAAFKGCSSLESISLPDNLIKIEDSTFFGCSSLNDVTIPSGVKNIGDSAFDGCEELPPVLSLPDGLQTIGDGAFSGCSSVTKAEIPESVVEYGDGIFANCSSLTEPILPDNLTEIPDGMFMGCTALATPQIPDSVEVYGDGCFRGCSSLKPIEYSENVTSINNDAFNDCDSLDTIVIPSSVTNIGDYAFSDCDSLENAELNEGLAVIGAGAFAYCDSLEDIAIPASCKKVESGAFMECSSLKGVDIPDTDIGFGSYVFAECSSLKEIQFPEGTTELGDYMFSGCSDSLTVACFSTSSIYEKAVDTIDNIETIVPVESITLDKSELNIIDKESVTLTPVISPANATDKSVTWFVDHPEIASVDENGVVKIYGSGTFTVTAQTNDEKYSASCVINSTIPVRGIALSDDNQDAYTGDEIALHYTFEPLDATNFNVTFSSSDETVASVSADGVVTVNNPGKAAITVTTEDGGYTSACTIDAEQYIPVEKILVNKNVLSLKVGESSKINATCQPNDASFQDIVYFIAEEDRETLEIDESGNISALCVGQVEVRIIADNIEETCMVTVLPNIFTVTWNVDGVETMQEYEPGATIQKPADPQKEGYIFKGWTPAVPDTMPAEDITFTAVFEVDPAADNLTIAKSDAKTTIDNTVPVGASDAVIAIANETKAAIDAATDETSVQAIAESGIAAINAQIQKEQDEVAAQALAEAKATAKSEIDALANGKSAAVQTIANTAKQNIDSAVDIAEVNTAKQNGIKAINDQIAKENKPDDPVNPTANAKLNVKSSTSADYRANVTITATATGVPDGYVLALYDGNTKIATGDNTKVSHNVGNMTASKTYTVKVIDPSNNAVQKDGNGAELSRTCEINVNTGFFARLIAFFRGLFGLLPNVEIRP